jgi:hypothetical protein
MDYDAHAKREPIVALLTTLHSKFAANLKVLDCDVTAPLEIIDLNSRAIDGIAGELKRLHSGEGKHKLECAHLIDEIFADHPTSPTDADDPKRSWADCFCCGAQ